MQHPPGHVARPMEHPPGHAVIRTPLSSRPRFFYRLRTGVPSVALRRFFGSSPHQQQERAKGREHTGGSDEHAARLGGTVPSRRGFLGNSQQEEAAFLMSGKEEGGNVGS